MSYVHLTSKSSNAKTGPIPVSTSTAAWCPDSCPLKGAGCYGNGGPLAIQWKARHAQLPPFAYDILTVENQNTRLCSYR